MYTRKTDEEIKEEALNTIKEQNEILELQHSKIYSEDEVVALLIQHTGYIILEEDIRKIDSKQWFELNKK